MPTINKSTLVAYTTEQMYDLVNDIDHYHEFVPYCEQSTVLSRDEDEVRATLAFAKSGMSKAFTTLNRLQPHRMIEMRLVEGPFKMLEGFWRFESNGDGTSNVRLDLEFEFSNRLLAMMFGPVFHQAASMLVDAFSDRAKAVYGEA